MKIATIIWIILIGLFVTFLGARAALVQNAYPLVNDQPAADAVTERGFGKAYVRETEKEFIRIRNADGEEAWLDATDPQVAAQHDISAIPQADRVNWTHEELVPLIDYLRAEHATPGQTSIRFSWWNTIGLWVAAFFTLAIFSFLYKDNPFYKIAESVVVGVSAAYWMVVGFWDTIVPNLLAKLAPGPIHAWALPDVDPSFEWKYFIPLILGILLLWRLAPAGAWIARWPLAFIIGTTAGLRLIAYLQGDFLQQINAAVDSLIVLEAGEIEVWASMDNMIRLFGTLCCLVYFFFSIEHKGVVGKTAKIGIWFLMITFGAAFGFTVMGRIALLAIRIEFLFDDWLWLVDPANKREALSMLLTLLRLPG